MRGNRTRPTHWALGVCLAAFGFGMGGARAHGQVAVSPIDSAVQIGLSPEALVVADLDAYTDSILAQMNAAENLRSQLKSAQEAVTSAVDTLSIINLMIVEADDSSSAVQHEAAALALQIACSQLDQVAQQMRNEIAMDLPVNGVALLTMLSISHEFAVPAEFRIMPLSVEQWKDVEGALRAERRALRRGESLDADQDQLLSTIRGSSDVIAASMRTTTHLSIVQTMFTNYSCAEELQQ